MHWVIQNNLHREPEYENLLKTLDRFKISYDLVKVIPFCGDLEPDINPTNPIMVIGSTSLVKTAQKRGWGPGVFFNDNFNYQQFMIHWLGDMVNSPANWAMILPFKDIPDNGPFAGEDFFIRPNADLKQFAGRVITVKEFAEWKPKVLALEESSYTTLPPDTLVLVARSRYLTQEYRFFVVNGTIITGCQYKLGTQVRYDSHVDKHIWDFAQSMVNIWQPDKAFAIDIALVECGCKYPIPKILEINCINSSGFYALDMNAFVGAIEQLT